MMKNHFLKAIEQSLAKHKNYLAQTVKPAITILKDINIETRLGCSRFGGAPDLAIGREWPMHEQKPYRFLGQINFSEISSSDNNLPFAGLLSLFFVDNDYNSNDYLEAFEDGFIHAFYTSETEQLKTVTPPYENIGPAISIHFSPTIDIPYNQYQVKDWPFDEQESESYDEIRESLHESSNYLLGYPSHFSLGYDPTPSSEWLSLLTIDSDDDLNWFWHDYNKLMIFIEKERLEKLDFSNLKTDAG